MGETTTATARSGYVSAYSITAGPSRDKPSRRRGHQSPSVKTSRAVLCGLAFDYKGEPRPFGWPVVNCHYGFFDLCGFPKDSYYYYKAWWSNEPVLHVFPHWNWAGKDGQEIPVWVHIPTATKSNSSSTTSRSASKR
jgi:beta-galactosidase